MLLIIYVKEAPNSIKFTGCTIYYLVMRHISIICIFSLDFLV